MREYLLIRSKRKTVALAIKEDGTLEVRAPMRLSKKWIDGFVEQKEGWIQQKTAETAKRAAARRQLTPQEEENLRLRGIPAPADLGACGTDRLNARRS